MRKSKIALIAAVTVSAATILQGWIRHEAPAQGTIEAEIRATHARMKLAAESLDAAALYEYVSDTSTPPIIEDGQLAPSRAAALERTTAGLRQLTRLSYAYSRDNVTVLAPDTVLWVAEGTVTAALADGRSIGGPFAETVVFSRRDGGQWKVLHAHRSAPDVR